MPHIYDLNPHLKPKPIKAKPKAKPKKKNEQTDNDKPTKRDK